MWRGYKSVYGQMGRWTNETKINLSCVCMYLKKVHVSVIYNVHILACFVVVGQGTSENISKQIPRQIPYNRRESLYQYLLLNCHLKYSMASNSLSQIKRFDKCLISISWLYDDCLSATLPRHRQLCDSGVHCISLLLSNDIKENMRNTVNLWCIAQFKV